MILLKFLWPHAAALVGAALLARVGHTAPSPAPAPAPAAGAFVNPRVAPGKVRWHADFAAACRASARTGRPVLLFQMMGRLDDRFC